MMLVASRWPAIEIAPGRISELGDKSSPIVVYCRSGNRSSEAKKLLKARGFSKVKNGGGLDDMMKLAP